MSFFMLFCCFSFDATVAFNSTNLLINIIRKFEDIEDIEDMQKGTFAKIDEMRDFDRFNQLTFLALGWYDCCVAPLNGSH